MSYESPEQARGEMPAMAETLRRCAAKAREERDNALACKQAAEGEIAEWKRYGKEQEEALTSVASRFARRLATTVDADLAKAAASGTTPATAALQVAVAALEVVLRTDPNDPATETRGRSGEPANERKRGVSSDA